MLKLLAAFSLLTIACLANEKPNILYIFTDDQSHRTVSCYPESYSWVNTPNIDKIAKEGVRFERAYIGTFCVPSRVSMLTSNLQHAVGDNVKVANPKNLQGAELRQVQQDANFWPRRLRNSGYHTGMIGKWHLYAQAPAYNLDWDWCLWWDRNLPGNGKAYYENTVVRLNDGPGFPLNGYATDRYTDYAVEYIQERSKEDKPWFLWMCYSGVHGPFTPAKRHIDKYSEVNSIKPPATIFSPREGKPHYSKYYDEWKKNEKGAPVGFTNAVKQYPQAVASIDEGVGRIISTLQKTKQLENTVVIFTSDQGLAMGQQGQRAEKAIPYDSAIRGPLIFSYPKLFPKDKIAKVAVNGVDVVQTIHSLTGLEPLPHMDGESFVKVLHAPEGDHSYRRPMLMCNTKPSFGNSIPPRMKREIKSHESEIKDKSSGKKRLSPMWAMIIDGKYKYARYAAKNYIEEIYDLENDPEEVTNLANNPEFKNKLLKLRKLCKDEFLKTRSGWNSSVAKHFIELFPHID